MSNSENKYQRGVWTLFFLIMLKVFLPQDDDILLSLESLKEKLIFHNLDYVLKHRQNIIFPF